MLSFIVIQIGEILSTFFKPYKLKILGFIQFFSDKISQTTVLRIEPPWENNSAPALIKTKELEHKNEPITITRTDETKISTNKARVNA